MSLQDWRGSRSAVALLWRVLRPWRGLLPTFLGLSALLLALSLSSPLFFHLVIDRVLGAPAFAGLAALLGFMASLHAVEWLAGTLRLRLQGDVARALELRVGRRLAAALVAGAPRGEATAPLLRQQLGSLRSALAGALPGGLVELLGSLLLLGLLAGYGRWLALVAVLGMAASVTHAVAGRGVVRARQRALSRREHDLGLAVDGWLRHGAARRANACEARGRQALGGALRWRAAAAARAGSAFGAAAVTGQLIARLTQLAVLGCAATLAMEERLSVGGLVAATMVASRLSTMQARLSGTLAEWDRLVLALQALGPVLGALDQPIAEPCAERASPPVRRQDALVLSQFMVRDAGRVRLSPLSVSLAGGSLVVVVGVSGAGKTSLGHALAGALPGTCGHMSLGPRAWAEPADPAWRGTVHYADGTLPGDREDMAALIGAAVARSPKLFPALGLCPNRCREPGSLSDGERAYLAVALALASPAPVLYLDGVLDALPISESMALLPRLRERAERGIVLLATAHAALAAQADRVLELPQAVASAVAPARPGGVSPPAAEAGRHRPPRQRSGAWGRWA